MLPTFKLSFFALLACVTLASGDQLSKDLANAAGIGSGFENPVPEFLPDAKCDGSNGPWSGDCDDLRFNLDKKDPLVRNQQGHQYLCNKTCCITAAVTSGTEKIMTQGDLAKWGYQAARKCNGPNLQSYRSAKQDTWPAPDDSGAQFTMCMSTPESMKGCKR